jgi:serine/threonine protein kinase
VKYSENLKELIEKMLNINPLKRPTVTEILNMGFIKDQIKILNIKQKEQQIKKEEIKRRQKKRYQKSRLTKYFYQKSKIKSARVSYKKKINSKPTKKVSKNEEKVIILDEPKSKKEFKIDIEEKTESKEEKAEDTSKVSREQKKNKLKLEIQKIKQITDMKLPSHRIRPPSQTKIQYLSKKSYHKVKSKNTSPKKRYGTFIKGNQRKINKKKYGFKSKSTKVNRSKKSPTPNKYYDLFKKKYKRHNKNYIFVKETNKKDAI